MKINLDNLTINIFLGVLLGISLALCKGLVLMFVIIAMTGIMLWKFLPESDRKFLLMLFIFGMLLRILIFGLFYFSQADYAGGGELVPDSRLYNLRAVNIARDWLGYPMKRVPYEIEGRVGENGYLYILAIFYILIGYIPPHSAVDIERTIVYSLFSDKLINCLIGTLTGIVIFYIAKEIFNKKAAKIVSILVVFFPSLFFWSMTNVRDPINILLVALIILLIIRSQIKAKAKYFILLFLSLLLLFTIRQYVFFPMLIIVLFSLLVLAFRKLKNKAMFVLLAIIFLAVLFNFTGQGGALKNKIFDFDSVAKKIYSLNTGILSQKGYYYKIYDDDFLVNGRVDKLKFMKAFFKGWAYFMFTPFPWTLSSINQIITYPQVIIWYLMFPFAFIGMLLALRYRFNVSLSLLCYVLLLTSLYALVEGNIGSAMRHRDLLTPFYLIFSSAGIVKVFKGKSPFEEEA
jgi:hypothetical protein